MISWPKADAWADALPALKGQTDLTIAGVSSINDLRDHTLVFVNRMKEEFFTALQARKGCLMVLPANAHEACAELETHNGVLYADHPRYEFTAVLDAYTSHASIRGALTWDAERGISIGEDVRIHPGATVELGVSIGRDSVIEEGAYIMTGARIGPRVIVGPGSTIRENAVVGGYGFGFAFGSARGLPNLRIPHLGGVVIGRNVEIGALTTVCSGTLAPTVIKDGAMIDDHVHLAHNVVIGEEAVIIACAEISGSVKVGERAWVAPQASVLESLTIGKDSVVGMGAVVTRAVEEGSVVMGNPARTKKDLAVERRKLKKLLNSD